MTKHVIETVTFKLNAGFSREDFAKSASAITDFAKSRPGFIARRLSCGEDGLWIEHIEWATMKDAKDAAAAIGGEASLAPAMQAIDGSTVTMHHSELEISEN